jgi:hypothetical protein
MPLTIDLSPSGFSLTDEVGHTVEIPNSLSGLIFLHSLLKARQEWGDRAPTIGTLAAPTQAMVKAFLATHSVAPAPPAKTAAQIAAGEERQRQRIEDMKTVTARFEHLDLDLEL